MHPLFSGTAAGHWKSIRFRLICISPLTAKENGMEKALGNAICMPQNNFLPLAICSFSWVENENGAHSRKNVFGSLRNVVKFNLTSSRFGPPSTSVALAKALLAWPTNFCNVIGSENLFWLAHSAYAQSHCQSLGARGCLADWQT